MSRTERVIEGEEVTVGGIPVTIELDRGELRIHVGNTTSGAMHVRVTTSGPAGRVSGSSTLMTYAQRDPDRRFGQRDPEPGGVDEFREVMTHKRRSQEPGGLARVLGEPWPPEDQTLEDIGPR